jgi:drug/metabolite transporter (DMT)-like permease
MMLVVLGATLAAELCIGLSIANKNATLAGLIEITYPIFIALIGFALIRENNLNVPTALAAVLIFSGVGLIYFFNR